jgi:probable HAF family extracellular repeat protein
MFSKFQLMRLPIQLFSTALLFIACVCTTTSARAAATFTPLGLFGGAGSEAYDVSADGSVVVGFVTSPTGARTGLFRWTAAGTVILPGPFASSPPSVSADGTTVVAQYGSLEPLGSAFRWTAGGSVESLGASAAHDVSADGRVVVGLDVRNGRELAYRWTPESGIVALGDVPGGSERQWANGVSADGSVIVGYVNVQSRDSAFRWTTQTGMVELPPRSGAPGARRVSAVGLTVVGTRTLPPPVGSIHPQHEAFRWAESNGLIGLGGLTTQLRFETYAYDVSADGSVIVGAEEPSADIREHRAFYWSNGIANLRDELIRLGAPNLDGWHLAEAWGVSADGLTIVGRGRFEGQTQAWIATLPYPVPEPSTFALVIQLAAGFIALHMRAARAQRSA